MRVAIVAPPYGSIPAARYGGIEQVVYYLIKGLKEAGHEPILLAPGDSKVDCELIPIADKHLPFPLKKADLPKFRREAAKIHRRTKKILKELMPRIDIIHSHPDIPIQSFDMLGVADFPNLTTLHGIIQIEDLPYYMKRKDSLYFASISKNQQAVCPELRYMGVVYNGEDPSLFPVVTKPEDYVCFLGRFDRDKNPHLAIELAVSLGIKIKVAGKLDLKGEDYYETEIAKYKNHPLVEIMGELNFEEKVRLLSNAKCNLHPTNFREPFGLTVLEAAYCGTPTLATARGSMPELIEVGRTGFLVEDFIEGRSHMEECFAMDREYVASRARQLFNYQTMTQQYIEAYEKVIEAMPAKRKHSVPILQKWLTPLLQRFRTPHESQIL